MVNETLSFLASEVNKFLDSRLGTQPDPRLKIGNVSRAFDDSGSGLNPLTGNAILSLINIEEETFSRSLQSFKNSDTHTTFKQPQLNLYLLFSMNRDDYEESLKWLAEIILFFQYQPLFTSYTHAEIPSKIQELMVEMYFMNFEQVNHLWSVQGGKYLPSVVYKVRQTTINESFREIRKDYLR